MNRAQQVKQPEEFEQVLLSYAEMCYSVAFALTRNPRRAQDLARYALTWAWHQGDNVDGRTSIKQKLLKALRERFLDHYCQPSCGLRTTETSGEDTVGVAQRAEWNIGKVSPSVPSTM
jgi:DNA-directed RNA polymerase specialized sigma24 family protein